MYELLYFFADAFIDIPLYCYIAAGIFFIFQFIKLLQSEKLTHFFVFLFFLLLCLPLFSISKNDTSEKENRKLAEFPQVFSDKKINYNFGIDFDKWLSDHFWGRQHLIDLRFNLLYFINGRIANNDAFMGDDGWLFPTYGITHLSSIEEQHKKVSINIKMLKKIDNYLYKKGIKLYLILEPSRSLLYKTSWQKYWIELPHFDYVNELKKELKLHRNIHFINLSDVFEKNKTIHYLYEKDDNHMTLYAINLMLKKIASELGDKFLANYQQSITFGERKCKLLFFSKYYSLLLNIEVPANTEVCKEIKVPNIKVKNIVKENGYNESTVDNPYMNNELYLLFPCYGEFIYPVLEKFFAKTISVNYKTFEEHDEDELRNKALNRLKSLKPGSFVIIFLSYPTENNDTLDKYLASF